MRHLPLILALLAPATVMAQAAKYPVKPVTIVVPFGPGAGADVETRTYAQKLGELTGHSFVTDYKPGAGTTIGSAFVAKAAPDGYTLLTVTSSFTTAPALYPVLAYDPVKDFAPITMMSQRATIIVAHASAPYRSVAEYVAYARAHPGEVTVGTTGSGGSAHLNGAWFHGMAGSRVTFVHYKTAANGMTDLVAGRVQSAFASAISAMPHVKSGKLKVIAVGNAEGSPLLPDVPSVAAQGYPEYDYSSLFGLVAPAGVPAPIIGQLHAELLKVSQSPEVARRIQADGGVMVGSTPAQFRDALVKEIVRYKQIVQSNHIKLEE